MPRLRFKNKNQSGDTIIEVLASIALVGVALAGGYALSSHSLRTGIDAAERSSALSLAQGQVEFLKYSASNPQVTQYTGNAGQPFCINDSNGNKMTNISTGCTNINGTPYNILITYNGSTRVFTIRPSWDSFGSNVRGEMSLYYKLPDTF